MRDWYSFRAATDSSGVAEILIFDEIGAGWLRDGVTAKQLVTDLGGIDEPKIIVRINSPGGDVFDGIAIMNALKAHPATVTCVVEGLAASAASFIAVGAGDEVIMRPEASLMIHDAWGVCEGPASEMERLRDELDRQSANLARIYAAKTGKTAAEMRELMLAESWFNAEEAAAIGLVDGIADARAREPVLARREFPIMASYKYSGRGAAPRPLVSATNVGAGKGHSDMSVLNDIAARLGVAADEETVMAAIDGLVAVEPENSSVAAADEGVSVDEPEETGEPDKTEEPEEAEEAEESDDGDTATLDGETTTDTGGEDLADTDPDDSAEDELTVTMDREKFEELQLAAAYGREAKAREKAAARAAIVDKAIQEDKISASSRGKWLASLEADEEGTKARLERLASGTVPRNELGHGLSAPDTMSNTVVGADWAIQLAPKP